ncbi:hypothetical protein C8Q80DRAFT_239835 [Daedaleopsis nitida]|nr:hypothetical protein C8Q80DRAFT_239835 [Daedaleopsis nitida]
MSVLGRTSLCVRARCAADDLYAKPRAPSKVSMTVGTIARRLCPHPHHRPPLSSPPESAQPMYYSHPQRPASAYYPRSASPVMSMSPMYNPGSYSGSYYDHSPEMRMVPPMYPHYAQPLPQPAMLYRQQPIYYNRLLHRHEKPCCNDICCDRCCDECCGPQCCC